MAGYLWPEDVYGLCDVNETFYQSVAANSVKAVLGVNPQRIALLAAADLQCWLTTAASPVGKQGLAINGQGLGALYLSSLEVGPLVGQAWWLNTSGAAGVSNVTIIEVVLNRHPQPQGA